MAPPCPNLTTPAHGNNVALDVAYIVLELVIAVLAILGNILVCWAVYLNSNLQNVTNYFVVSLAVADIAVGLLAIPFAIAISTGFCASFYGCLFIVCFVLVLTQSSIFSLLAIAIDRIIAVRIPLRYNALVTGSRAKGIIAIFWVLSFIIGLTPMLGWHKYSSRGAEQGGGHSNASVQNCSSGLLACQFESVVTMEYMVYYNFFACVLLPLLLMFGIYLKIFMAARRQLKQMENKVAHGERARSTLQKEVHAAKSLSIIVGWFAFCWLPMHIVNCYILFCACCPRPPLWLMYVAIILSHANSVVNPMIYAYRVQEFRHTFHKIIGQHILGKKERFKPSSSSQRTSVHAENTSAQISEYALDFYPPGPMDGIYSESSLGKHTLSLDWHQNGTAFDGEANGHILQFYKNGDLSGASKTMELLSKELLGVRLSYTDLETSALEASDVS
ncbi:adenosine receptor A2a [Hemicordylus capensis]|uniref:adenosine receptor A2a n=1 Tax=Hemicordylus capensis TaxID=884348 RepID=UPI002302F58C|nr:adenosine receptor A2a [Hemicordylus capensis]XP_053135146.1 adenosine receptor A2a [Hemicordylus capensis]XP_053135147.1 adenosine receptor A2a [Hemicordylus capensis]XP_053135148.1 adenosine receptor A2a [Hemicordylus capensis]